MSSTNANPTDSNSGTSSRKNAGQSPSPQGDRAACNVATSDDTPSVHYETLPFMTLFVDMANGHVLSEEVTPGRIKFRVFSFPGIHLDCPSMADWLKSMMSSKYKVEFDSIVFLFSSFRECSRKHKMPYKSMWAVSGPSDKSTCLPKLPSDTVEVDSYPVCDRCTQRLF